MEMFEYIAVLTSIIIGLGMDYLYSLGLQYAISQAAIIVFAVIAIFSRHEKFHALFAIAGVAHLVVSGFLVYETVG